MTHLKMLRPINLIIVALTMYLVRFFLILPALEKVDFLPIQKEWEFALLVLSTLMITAAGYIINDYFDTRIDRVNKPESMNIGRNLSRRAAIIMHWVLSGIGLLLAAFLAYRIGMLKLVLIQIMAVFVLYKYSEVFKRKYLSGNILVSFLTALVVLLPAIFEYVSLITYQVYFPEKSKWLFLSLLAYAVFAFITTLIRELIKDMEDIEGDLDGDCKTLPIVHGIPIAKKYSYSIIALAVLLCIWFQRFKWNQQETFSIYYVLIFIQLPFLLVAYQLYKAEVKADFTKASKYLKLLMILGLISMPVFYFIKNMS